MLGKGAFLKRLTATTQQMRSVEVGREIDGSTPPSVFIGSWNYPKVYAGPMIAPLHGDTAILDTPEAWIPAQKTQDEIIGFRMNLVRGKHQVGVRDLDNRFTETLRDIGLSGKSIESEAAFDRAPTGSSFSDEHTVYGPSAEIERFEIGNVAWDRDLERVYFDSDLRAGEAIVDLHRKGVQFSGIQKALSVGAIGNGRDRRLVPTRWSITAVDSTIANSLLAQVRKNQVIDCVQVREFSSLNNHYAVMLVPTAWQYEWMEAFLQALGSEDHVFADHESNRGKTEYSSVGGCYYSCKMAVLETLAKEGKQAGAIVLREARRGYVPLGVFNVRENVRNAMLQKSVEYEDIPSALADVSQRFVLPVSRFVGESTLLSGMLHEKQTTLDAFSTGAASQ
ncbi:MAG: hypothetical protein LUQ25_09230 [Methanoregulaceae archaeon]|nr:hypothetical protein [Methanoregulaceae archaeon]